MGKSWIFTRDSMLVLILRSSGVSKNLNLP